MIRDTRQAWNFNFQAARKVPLCRLFSEYIKHRAGRQERWECFDHHTNNTGNSTHNYFFSAAMKTPYLFPVLALCTSLGFALPEPQPTDLSPPPPPEFVYYCPKFTKNPTCGQITNYDCKKACSCSGDSTVCKPYGACDAGVMHNVCKSSTQITVNIFRESHVKLGNIQGGCLCEPIY